MLPHLFYESGSLSDFLDNQKSYLKKEVENTNSNELLNLSEDDFCKYLVDKYSLKFPEIRESDIHISNTSEVDIDVSQDPLRGIMDRSRPFYIKGASITISIPFDGDGKLFNYRPSRFNHNPPTGIVHGQELQLVYETLDYDDKKIKQFYDHKLGSIKQYLNWVKEGVASFNNGLEGFSRTVIKNRKNKILADLGLANALGLPIKRSDNIPKTYSVQVSRKITSFERPRASTEKYIQEPALPESEYEYILGVIKSMSLVMERNPNSFSQLNEPQIRNQFLMILNSHYEGQATGETFNAIGKTDILIRHTNKNVFIAECKFWRGRKELIEAIDQLIGYTSWRDTKTAILLFNKNKDFSSVISKIDSTIKSHACYKRVNTLKDRSLKDETIFSFIFNQPKDKNREFYLSVLAFDIP